jgi:transcriptional regulator with GAF, ATPase, and Fis domain
MRSISVLLLGESGTGKEMFAQAIHKSSTRRNKPIKSVNCAALSKSLLESELFGHSKGAFTGAEKERKGLFEIADGGTLFLDEIGDLPLDLQAKLLRVLQEGEFERLGSGQTLKVDVRIIAATNRELDQLVRSGEYRPDLYYRLNTFPLQLPPLRARREDIPLLVWYFISKHQSRLDKRIDRIPAAVMQALQDYDWPGNVRELENLIERALILSAGATLQLDEKLLVQNGPQSAGAATAATPCEQDNLQEIERDHILSVIRQCRWKIQGSGNAAERLGLKPSTLRWKMKKLGIERP